MADPSRAAADRPIHPLHAILLSFPLPLFAGALVGDVAYFRTHQIDWSNLAQWLNAGGLLVGAFAMLWALVSAIAGRRAWGAGRRWLYALALAAALITGLLNAFIHSRDAWGIMPAALWWSAISTLLALAASWLGFSHARTEEIV